MKKNLYRVLIVVLIIFAFIGYEAYKDEASFVVTIYDVETREPELIGKTIVQISDLHDKSYGENNSQLIDAIDSYAPNYIFITGDVVSATDTDYKNVYDLVSYIGNEYDCYYITGNHEQGLSNSNFNELLTNLVNYNVKLMNSNKVELSENVDLYGLDYSGKYYIQKQYTIEEMKNDLGTPDEDKYIILLTHNPKDFNIYAEWGANLIFAGHTHGGMVRIFDRGVISTERTLFPDFDGGIYFRNGIKSQMIVSKGLSRGNKGFRLFNSPELVVVNFVGVEG